MLTPALLLALVPVAFAQYGDSSPSTPQTTTTEAAAAAATATPATVHTVAVGNGAFTFEPNTTIAAVGDIVEFMFYGSALGFSGLTHSVVEADAGAPCVPMAGNTGFFSGGFTTSGTAANETVFVLNITGTDPIWFFCGFPTHCGTGMVGVINPPTTGNDTIETFAAAAAGMDTISPTFEPQGGMVEAASAVTASTTSPSPSTSAKGAANEARGSVHWGLLALTGIVAAGFGGLII